MKIKRKIISILLAMILFVNVPLIGFKQVYADTSITTNPLFIPMTAFVTSVAVGTGIVAQNSVDALNGAKQLISNVTNNLKNAEIAKKQADENYISPFKVINGQGQPEEPNENNKNGKWVALAGGAIASSEIWANKDAVISAMQEINNLKGYDKTIYIDGIVNIDNLLNTTTPSAIALQLANISNSAVKQFDDFLHSAWWDNKDFTPDDCIFLVNTYIPHIIRQKPILPYLYVDMYIKSDELKYLQLPSTESFGYNTYSNDYGSLSYYYALNNSNSICPKFLDENYQELSMTKARAFIYSRENETTSVSYTNYSNTTSVYYNIADRSSGMDSNKLNAYSGYKWFNENPWTYTNNVYNVNQTFDLNFPDWLQSTLNLLNENLQGVRLGIQSLDNPWNVTQEQIQSGTSPSSVINQYINYYEAPEEIPEDNPQSEPEPEPEPEPDPEPVTETMLDDASQSLWDWAISKITLPDGIWEKIPFSIPYDCYLLVKAVLPSSGGGTRKKMLRASYNAPDNPDGITISSYFDANGADVRSNQATLTVPSKWSSNAPVINWDLHFKYTDLHGQKQTFDYVKTVDLGQYGYFAMIIYICIYVSWMGTILGFIFDSFK